MNTMTRRCCPGCGAPAPLALGQDWCRYCKEFIGVSKDMAVAVQQGPSADQWDRLTDVLESLEESNYVHETYVGVDHVAQNLMADRSWPARLEACRKEDEAAEAAVLRQFEAAPIDWATLLGKFAINALCAVVFAVPLLFVLWTIATVMMGL